MHINEYYRLEIYKNVLIKIGKSWKKDSQDHSLGPIPMVSILFVNQT